MKLIVFFVIFSQTYILVNLKRKVNLKMKDKHDRLKDCHVFLLTLSELF